MGPSPSMCAETRSAGKAGFGAWCLIPFFAPEFHRLRKVRHCCERQTQLPHPPGCSSANYGTAELTFHERLAKTERMQLEGMCKVRRLTATRFEASSASLFCFIPGKAARHLPGPEAKCVPFPGQRIWSALVHTATGARPHRLVELIVRPVHAMPCCSRYARNNRQRKVCS